MDVETARSVLVGIVGIALLGFVFYKLMKGGRK